MPKLYTGLHVPHAVFCVKMEIQPPQNMYTCRENLYIESIFLAR